MTSFDQITTLKLSIQRALLGEVTDRFLAVTCGIHDRLICIKAYVIGDICEKDLERVQVIAAEVIADFPEGYTVKESCVSAKNENPKMLDFWAFMRAGERDNCP